MALEELEAALSKVAAEGIEAGGGVGEAAGGLGGAEDLEIEGAQGLVLTLGRRLGA